MRKVIFLAALMLLLAPAGTHAHSEEGHICFSEVEMDGDGLADFDEFAAVYGEGSREMFEAFDTDGDGYVSHMEYEEGFAGQEG